MYGGDSFKHSRGASYHSVNAADDVHMVWCDDDAARPESLCDLALGECAHTLGDGLAQVSLSVSTSHLQAFSYEFVQAMCCSVAWSQVWDLKAMKCIFTFNSTSQVYCLALTNNFVYGGCQVRRRCQPVSVSSHAAIACLGTACSLSLPQRCAKHPASSSGACSR